MVTTSVYICKSRITSYQLLVSHRLAAESPLQKEILRGVVTEQRLLKIVEIVIYPVFDVSNEFRLAIDNKDHIATAIETNLTDGVILTFPTKDNRMINHRLWHVLDVVDQSINHFKWHDIRRQVVPKEDAQHFREI